MLPATLVLVACSSSAPNDAPSGGPDAAVDAEGGVPRACDIAGDVRGASPTEASFVDVAASAGLDVTGGNCLVFDDFDGDGRADVLVGPLVSMKTQSITTYLGDGAGHFVAKATSLSFDAKEAMIGACAAGDFDADGRLDVVVSSYFAREAHLLHNEGGGAFTDVQTLTLPVSAEYTALTIGAADYDGDGWLDVVMAPQGAPPKNGTDVCGTTPEGFACTVPGTRCAPPPFVFRNVSGAFAAVPESVTSATECGAGNTNALAILDWNDDGKPDLFVANDWGGNRLYVHGPDAHFLEVWGGYGTKSYNHGMGAAFEDFDRDGLLDVYISDIGSDQLYLRAAGDKLVPHGVDWGVASPTRLHSGWAPTAEDFDDDGVTDVFVANAAFVDDCEELKNAVADGMQLSSKTQYDMLLVGKSGGGFSPRWVRQTKDASPIATFGALAVADFDGDGRLDLLEGVGYPMRLQLLHNESPARHWLDVRLVGRKPNVDGIGATVTLIRAGKPAWRRYVQRSRGTIGASSPIVHFGLGDDVGVDRVEVRWPDGAKQTVDAPTVDGRVIVTQP